MKHLWVLATLTSLLGVARGANATPRPLPFTYQHEQLARGDAEFEQFGDFTLTRATEYPSGEPGYYGLYQFQTEFEYGITDRLELGLYFTYAPAAATGYSDTARSFNGNGFKQRLRYQLAPTGVWPIDVSVYGELAENERELEIEAKIILQRRIDRLRIIANLVGEQEFYFNGKKDLVFAPSAGITFEASPIVQPGFEWWMRAEYPLEDPPHPRPFELGPHHYVGPALLLSFGRLWWSSGAYLRVSEHGHSMQRGESAGPIWFRTVVGFGL